MYFRKLQTVLLLVAVATLLAACATRSISNSGYDANVERGYAPRDNPFYKGELSEFAVLGIDENAPVSEADIQRALSERSRIVMPRGTSIMLVQSGAMIPDDDMVKDLGRFYNVAVFSGVPPEKSVSTGNFSRALRLAAARGGADRIVVYWGILESGRENLATKVVSWVPFVGGVIPDENQRMRIRMKVAVVDVKSGTWEVFSPEPFEDTSVSGRYSRASSDQTQVALLKGKAYKSTAEDMVKRFAR